MAGTNWHTGGTVPTELLHRITQTETHRTLESPEPHKSEGLRTMQPWKERQWSRWAEWERQLEGRFSTRLGFGADPVLSVAQECNRTTRNIDRVDNT